MPTLNSHTHCQVAPADPQAETWQRLCLLQRTTDRQCSKNERKLTRKMNNETLTKCICHKGFSGYSSIFARSNFRVGGQDTAPQSLTAHTLNRYSPF